MSHYNSVVERQFKCHEYQVFHVAYTLDFWELFSLASHFGRYWETIATQFDVNY